MAESPGDEVKQNGKDGSHGCSQRYVGGVGVHPLIVFETGSWMLNFVVVSGPLKYVRCECGR